MSDVPAQNTDRELWREREGDYYADSIHVTERGGIGINHSGSVFVMTLAEWHKRAEAFIKDERDATLKDELLASMADNVTLAEELDTLRATIAAQAERIIDLTKANAEVGGINVELNERIAALTARVKELEELIPADVNDYIEFNIALQDQIAALTAERDALRELVGAIRAVHENADYDEIDRDIGVSNLLAPTT